MAPAWLSVCQSAGVDPNSFRIWIHEGPEVTAPATVGRTIAVTNWSLYTLPQRNLEAVLAHELAHHLPLPQKVSLFLYWLSLPARMTGVVIAAGLKNSFFKRLIVFVVGVLTVGVFVLWYVTEFDYFTVLMLSPWAAPLLLPWLSRKGEEMADRTAADLGPPTRCGRCSRTASSSGPARCGARSDSASATPSRSRQPACAGSTTT